MSFKIAEALVDKYETEKGVKINSNLIFKLSVCHEKNKTLVSTVLSGMEVFEYLTLAADKVKSSLDPHTTFQIEILSPGNQGIYSELVNLLEVGSLIVADPKTYATEDNLRLFKDYS